MDKARGVTLWPAVVWLSLLALSCGEPVGKGPPTGTVTGTVTIDGRPLADAYVEFSSVTGQRPATGKTGPDGRYELIFTRDTKGAPLGEHVVSISTYDEIRGDDTNEIIPETVPAQYNRRTELRATVQPGANVIDFPLDSTGEVVQPGSRPPTEAPIRPPAESLPSGSKPATGAVTGKVTIDGQPLPEAVVEFSPVSGQRAAYGMTDVDGHYELIVTRDIIGAPLGEHVVSITTYREIVMEDDTIKIIPETVPALYNRRTELKATVLPGDNVIDFQLDSAGEVVQPASRPAAEAPAQSLN